MALHRETEIVIHDATWSSRTVDELGSEGFGYYVRIACVASSFALGSHVRDHILAGIDGGAGRRRNRLCDLLEKVGVATRDGRDLDLTVRLHHQSWLELGREGDAHWLLRIRDKDYVVPRRVPLDRYTRNAVLERDGRVCGICTSPIPEDEILHIDHILPVSRGGTNDPENLQVAHAVCNMRKGARVG